MRHFKTALQMILGLLAAGEHLGLLLWGAFLPWRSLSHYPEDEGLNRYLILASCLLVLGSLSAAAFSRIHLPRLSLLAAMATALPFSVGILLLQLNFAYLDPVVFYLALLPSFLTVLVPYWLASALPASSATAA
jgi:hypothetical protein